jgi:hypothetical protein
LTDEAKVIFSFDGSVFSIRCDGELIALAVEGTPWTVSFGVHAGDLRRLPRRLMHEHVSVSIWESRIRVGSRSYPGTAQGFGVIPRSKVQ